ncbi:MAG: DUF998 domain-containing protein, partial [Zoogloeaceae bacterium]|nr:DUF998 domain-containing protein [Zoogloeaceae bacterium]
MNALGSLGSLLAFMGIVVCLQHVQEGYDWRAQFISELALGAQGAWMLGAFISVALACFLCAQSLWNSAQVSPVRAEAVVALVFTGNALRQAQGERPCAEFPLRNAEEWWLPCPFPRVTRALFFIAAAAFLGAGLVTLQDHVNLHLLFV